MRGCDGLFIALYVLYNNSDHWFNRDGLVDGDSVDLILFGQNELLNGKDGTCEMLRDWLRQVIHS